MLQFKLLYFKGPLMVTVGLVGLWSVQVIARSPECECVDIYLVPVRQSRRCVQLI